jgi:hypothetical protein
MFFKLRGGHICFSHAYIGLPHVAREMHLSFENNNYWRPKSISINTTQQHNTSLRSILEYDSISSTSRARICSCLGKGARLWLVTKPSIYSFRIAHFTFILVLFFVMIKGEIMWYQSNHKHIEHTQVCEQCLE